MRNRAKCKKCSDIIESFFNGDHVSCKCGSIDVYGGESMKCAAIDWKDFIRVDDEGNEIITTIKNEERIDICESNTQPSRVDLIDMLDRMVKDIDQLPSSAMSAPITHYDHASLIMLISQIFKTE